jgi:hypothetical protein
MRTINKIFLFIAILIFFLLAILCVFGSEQVDTLKHLFLVLSGGLFFLALSAWPFP